MEVTDDGMLTVLRAVQPSKALSGILVMPAGISTDAREVQLAKAQLPMLVTDDGIVTVLRAVQP